MNRIRVISKTFILLGPPPSLFPFPPVQSGSYSSLKGAKKCFVERNAPDFFCRFGAPNDFFLIFGQNDNGSINLLEIPIRSLIYSRFEVILGSQ